MAVRFLSTCSVCASMPPVIRLPVAGSSGICPEINTKPFALMACEYGPMACGALEVETTSRVKPLMNVLQKSLSQIFADIRREDKFCGNTCQLQKHTPSMKT